VKVPISHIAPKAGGLIGVLMCCPLSLFVIVVVVGVVLGLALGSRSRGRQLYLPKPEMLIRPRSICFNVLLLHADQYARCF
jgi:hypothetical protein